MTDDLQAGAPVPGDDPATDAAEAAADAAATSTTSVDTVVPPTDGGDLELLRLIDRLAALLDRSDLTELEVEAGATGLVLRKPSALAPISVTNLASTSPAATTMTVPSSGEPSAAGREPAVASKPSIKAPLTGIFYASPAPGSAPPDRRMTARTRAASSSGWNGLAM